jgi:O-antigen/teichoic acid export membrane protein
MRRHKGAAFRVGAAILAYGFSQAIIGAAAFYRIPLLLDHFGPAVFGFFAILVGLWPWFNVPWDALKQAARVRAAEDPAAKGSARAAVSSLSASMRHCALAALAVAIVLGLSPFVIGLAKTAGIDRTDAFLAASSLGLAAALGCLFAPHFGVAEFHGATTRANLSHGLSAAVGLPAIVLAVGLDWSVATMVALTAFSYLLPLVTIRWWVALGARPVPATKESITEGNRTVRRLMVWSSAGVLGTGLDTLIVGVVLGPIDAGTYSVVQRVLVLALLVPTALGGLVTSHFARLRMTRSAEAVFRNVHRVFGLYCLVGAAVAAAFVVFAPLLVGWLTSEQLVAPLALYASFALTIFFHYASSPLLASMTSAKGLRVRNAVYVAASGLNIATSLALPRLIGLSGPAVASAGAGLLVLCVTCWQIRRNAAQIYGRDEKSVLTTAH